MSIRPTFTTIGQSSPASVGSGGWYRYNGDKPEKKRPPSDPLPQNVKATTAKQKRFAEYTRLRLEGKSKDEAAAEIGVAASTAAYYERELKDQQRRGAGDA